jgi:hypothetical protein
VPIGAAEDLTAHGFELISSAEVDADGAPIVVKRDD